MLKSLQKECIYVTVYKGLKAPDYGYALVCWGDYGWAKGFNNKIELIRDKTLMEGDNCRNHKYILKQ